MFKSRYFFKTKTLLQYGETECGLACLAIVFHYFGFHYPLAALRDETSVSRDGTRASTLLSLARQHGFEAEAYSLDLEALKTLPSPVILHWNFSHYVVFEGMRGNRVAINDPALGRITITPAMLNESFTGVAIVLNPSTLKQKQASSSPRQYLSHLLSLIAPIQLTLMVGLLLIGVLTFASTGMSAIFINHVLLKHQWHWLRPVIGITASLGLLLLMVSQLKEWLQARACVSLSLSEATRLLVHVLQWPAKVYALRSKGELLVVLNQLDASLTKLITGLSNITSSVITSVLMMMVLCLFNLPLALESLCLCLISLTFLMILSVRKQQAEKMASQAEGQSMASTLSAFNHLESIAIAGLQSWVFAEWLSSFYEKIHKQQSMAKTQSWINAYIKANQWSMPFIMLMMGVHQYELGGISLGSLVAITGINALLNRQWFALFEAVKSMQSAAASLDRVDDVYSVKQDSRFTLPPVSLPSSQPLELSVKNLTFYYNRTSAPALLSINFKVKPGEHIAFVGGSGSGKSTLGKLISGLLLPDEGEVCWGGVSLSQMSPEVIAACIAVVMQEATLMSGSLLENLTLWRDDIAMQHVHHVLNLVCLQHFIQARQFSLPLSANTTNISGGEMQRLELARALIQNTPLLILDEATSSLDQSTEAKIITHLKSLNKTVIHIAHRLSTIKDCDQIFVLEHGEIVEKGNYASLMALQSRFYDLVQAECHQGDPLAYVA